MKRRKKIVISGILVGAGLVVSSIPLLLASQIGRKNLSSYENARLVAERILVGNERYSILFPEENNEEEWQEVMDREMDIIEVDGLDTLRDEMIGTGYEEFKENCKKKIVEASQNQFSNCFNKDNQELVGVCAICSLDDEEED